MNVVAAARRARGMGNFTGYDFVKNPVCPFCGEQWGSQKPCGDQDPFLAGGWRAMNQRRKARNLKSERGLGGF